MSQNLLKRKREKCLDVEEEGEGKEEELLSCYCHEKKGWRLLCVRGGEREYLLVVERKRSKFFVPILLKYKGGKERVSLSPAKGRRERFSYSIAWGEGECFQ